jgi:hypothetical protein
MMQGSWLTYSTCGLGSGPTLAFRQPHHSNHIPSTQVSLAGQVHGSIVPAFSEELIHGQGDLKGQFQDMDERDKFTDVLYLVYNDVIVGTFFLDAALC